MHPGKNESGQSLVLAIVFLALATTLFTALFHISFAVKEKIRLQTAADLAVLSALNTQANGLNAIAIGNRSILAHGAFSAQLNAIVSESTFYRKLIDGFSKIIRFVPTVGPLLGTMLSRGGRTVEGIVRNAAKLIIPAAALLNTALRKEIELIRSTLALQSWNAARKSVEVNDPGASIILPAQALLMKQARVISSNIVPLSNHEANNILESTLDPHTVKRNWKLGSGALSLPVRKRGGSRISQTDFQAFDKLQFRIFSRFRLRWKTVLSAESEASDFRYRGHGKLFDLARRDIPAGLTLMLTKKYPELPGGLGNPGITLMAVSSGELFYHRPGKPEERPNLLNPFWKTRLIPVSKEETAGKIVPGMLLQEVRH